jgi:serine/threonine-protein kinase RsbW
VIRVVHDFGIPNDASSLAQVREETGRVVREAGFPEEMLNRLMIAVDEAVTNIIEHGYDGLAPGSSTIDIHLEVDRDRFLITITDQGDTFDPRTASDVDIAAHVAAGRSGGLGVFLIRKIMDVVEYHHETGRHNRLTMIKNR